MSHDPQKQPVHERVPHHRHTYNLYIFDDGHVSIATDQKWLPGLYSTRAAALKATEYEDTDLVRLIAELRKEQGIAGVITTEKDLKRIDAWKLKKAR